MSNYNLEPHYFPEYLAKRNLLPHPGAFIRDQLSAAGFTTVSAACAMALNRAELENVIAGKSAISRDLAYRLDALLNTTGEPDYFASLLIDRQARYDWEKEGGQSRYHP